MLFIMAKPFLQRFSHGSCRHIARGRCRGQRSSACRTRRQWRRICSFGTQGVNKGYAVFSLIILAPWAFVGFEVISFETSHFKFPVAKVGRIIVASILIAAFVYMPPWRWSAWPLPDGYSSWAGLHCGPGQPERGGLGADLLCRNDLHWALRAWLSWRSPRWRPS